MFHIQIFIYLTAPCQSGIATQELCTEWMKKYVLPPLTYPFSRLKLKIKCGVFSLPTILSFSAQINYGSSEHLTKWQV